MTVKPSKRSKSTVSSQSSRSSRSANSVPIAFTQAQLDEAELQIIERQKKIDYYITEFTVEYLAEKMKKEDYRIPTYQREFTWEEPRKHRFIESLIMRLPIPFLFFCITPDDGILEVVDGSQRLRTIKEFIDNNLRLGELSRLPKLKGFLFSDLPKSRQNKIKNISIRGIVLSENTDDESRFDLFDRINTGSKIANSAEVRRGAVPGPFIDLVKALASDPLFVKLTPMSKKQIDEREREELVTRLFAYGDGLTDYHDEVSRFLYSYTLKMTKQFREDPQLANIYRDKFNKVMQFAQKSFPYGFAKAEKGNATPRARFEALAVGSLLALQKKPNLTISTETVKSLFEVRRFVTCIRSDGANVRSKLENRIFVVRDWFLKRDGQ